MASGGLMGIGCSSIYLASNKHQGNTPNTPFDEWKKVGGFSNELRNWWIVTHTIPSCAQKMRRNRVQYRFLILMSPEVYSEKPAHGYFLCLTSVPGSLSQRLSFGFFFPLIPTSHSHFPLGIGLKRKVCDEERTIDSDLVDRQFPVVRTSLSRLVAMPSLGGHRRAQHIIAQGMVSYGGLRVHSFGNREQHDSLQMLLDWDVSTGLQKRKRQGMILWHGTQIHTQDTHIQ